MKRIKCDRCGREEDFTTKSFEVEECEIQLKIKTRWSFNFYKFDLCEECREGLPSLVGKVANDYLGKKVYWTYKEEMKGIEEFGKRLGKKA